MQNIVTFMQGLGTGLGLIVAIGAQNAFVLSQGIRGRYALPVVLVCIVCDALLIVAGVAGMGALIGLHPLLGTLMTIGGALFLFWYGLRSFRAAFAGGHLEAVELADEGLGAVIMQTLAVTLLNPHVYLDTLMLMGGISSRFEEPWIFGGGAVTASCLWFVLLGLSGRLLAPVFRSERAWRVLDLLIGLTMWGIAASLILSLR